MDTAASTLLKSCFNEGVIFLLEGGKVGQYALSDSGAVLLGPLVEYAGALHVYQQNYVVVDSRKAYLLDFKGRLVRTLLENQPISSHAFNELTGSLAIQCGGQGYWFNLALNTFTSGIRTFTLQDSSSLSQLAGGTS